MIDAFYIFSEPEAFYQSSSDITHSSHLISQPLSSAKSAYTSIISFRQQLRSEWVIMKP